MLLRPFLPLFGVDSVRLAEPYDGLADFCAGLDTDSAAAPYVGFDDGAAVLARDLMFCFAEESQPLRHHSCH